MTNSKNSSMLPSPRSSLVWSALVLAILGFADAFYLTVSHYQNKIPPCTIGGCETVLTSQYATIFGIPVSLIGVAYYLLIVVSLFAFIDSKNPKWLNRWWKLSLAGFIVTLGLVGLQVFVIHAICLYCMGSAAITTLLFTLALIIKNQTFHDHA